MKRFPFAKTLKALYKPLPRMSKQSRQAVADNLWIVAALLAVVAALSLTSALSLLSQADHISLFGVAIFVPNIAIIRLQQIKPEAGSLLPLALSLRSLPPLSPLFSASSLITTTLRAELSPSPWSPLWATCLAKSNLSSTQPKQISQQPLKLLIHQTRLKRKPKQRLRNSLDSPSSLHDHASVIQ